MRTISSRFVVAGEGEIFSKSGLPPSTHRNKAARTALFAFFILTVFALSGCNILNDLLGLGGDPKEPGIEPGKPDPFSVFKTVYVKEYEGDGEESGTIEAPYKTVEKALEKLAEYYAGNWPGKGGDNEDRGAIVILGLVEAAPIPAIDNSESIYPPIILYGDPGAALKLTGQGSLITLKSGAILTLRNITLTGISNNNAALIDVDGGHLIIEEDAVITGNTSSADFTGGGVRGHIGFITMKGGEISNNRSYNNGGGIFMGAPAGGTFEFNMTGGTITGNTAIRGGGIVTHDRVTFTMSGGTIDKNTADYGGGVQFYNNSAKLSMSGGKISDNQASSVGGGVYIRGSTFTISGKAIISGNSASGNGGGVYITTDGTFAISDEAIISGNSATSGNGGGVWFSSKGTFKKTGGVIYGDNNPLKNTANGGQGHAVYGSTISDTKKHDNTADTGVGLDSSTDENWE
jgi:hypothetical protein